MVLAYDNHSRASTMTYGESYHELGSHLEKNRERLLAQRFVLRSVTYMNVVVLIYRSSDALL